MKFPNWKTFLNWKEENRPAYTHFMSSPKERHHLGRAQIVLNSIIGKIILFVLDPTRTQQYVCCRDGSKRDHHHPEHQKKTEQTRAGRMSCKINNYCISRIVATEELKSEKVEVYYISTHTDHTLGIDECKHLPLPPSVKAGIQEQFATRKVTGEDNGL